MGEDRDDGGAGSALVEGAGGGDVDVDGVSAEGVSALEGLDSFPPIAAEGCWVLAGGGRAVHRGAECRLMTPRRPFDEISDTCHFGVTFTIVDTVDIALVPAVVPHF